MITRTLADGRPRSGAAGSRSDAAISWALYVSSGRRRCGRPSRSQGPPAGLAPRANRAARLVGARSSPPPARGSTLADWAGRGSEHRVQLGRMVGRPHLRPVLSTLSGLPRRWNFGFRCRVRGSPGTWGCVGTMSGTWRRAPRPLRPMRRAGGVVWVDCGASPRRSSRVTPDTPRTTALMLSSSDPLDLLSGSVPFARCRASFYLADAAGPRMHVRADNTLAFVPPVTPIRSCAHSSCFRLTLETLAVRPGCPTAVGLRARSSSRRATTSTSLTGRLARCGLHALYTGRFWTVAADGGRVVESPADRLCLAITVLQGPPTPGRPPDGLRSALVGSARRARASSTGLAMSDSCARPGPIHT